MNENMTDKEQLAWVVQETGRQLIAPVAAAWDWIMDTPYRIRESRENREKLENLEDPTLLERMMAPIAIVHIPVTANDEPVQIPVRWKIRRVLSIDGILAR